MKPLKIYYPILHISENTCEVWLCDHGVGISYKYLNNSCDDWVHEPSFIRAGLVTRERNLGKTPGLLLGSYFIKYSRKLETVFQFWTYSGVWFSMVQMWNSYGFFWKPETAVINVITPELKHFFPREI